MRVFHPLCIILVVHFLVLLFASVNSATTPNFEAIESWLSKNFDSGIKRLINLVSIPSVSANPKRAQDVRRAAQWLQSELKDSGMENIQLLETDGHPSVYADWLHSDPDAPTVLIYGHFDVQPEDPIPLWDSPPFEPRIKDDHMYARGASDDKGHMFVPIVAIRAYLQSAGKLPVNVKFLLEGEEEIGSPHLKSLLEKHKNLLRADYALSADGGQIALDIPGLCLGLRGALSMEIKVTVADSDMHSGLYGGGVQNPIHALVRLLDSLRDQTTGKILVDGYYDDVDPISQELKKDLDEYPLSYKNDLRMTGVNETVGEEGFSFHERTWLRPSMEIVGIKGGFQGDGIKTVLPREASAKISSRLVASQSAEKSFAQLKAHLEKEATKIEGVEVSLKGLKFMADPIKLGKSSVGIAAARSVLSKLYGREPSYFYMGGSIPAVTLLYDVLGLETVVFAFANSDEMVHAPNEFGRLSSFRRGQEAYVRMLWELRERHSKIGDEQRDEL